MTEATELSTVEKEINPAKKPAANPMVNVDGFKVRQNSIITTFSDTKKIDSLIKKVRDEALTVPIDLVTKKGRDLIASEAHKVSKMKTGVIKQMIDPSIEEAKALVKNVNGGKKHFQTEMDDLRLEVRKPLTDWEAAEELKEKARIEAIQEKIVGINSIAVFGDIPPGKDEITSLLEAVDAIDCEEGFDEFTQDALQAKSRAKEILTEKLNVIIQQELKEAADEELRLKEIELEKQQAKQKAQERVNNLMMIPVKYIGKPAEEIEKRLTALKNYEVPAEEFGDLYEAAKTSLSNVVIQLEAMHQQQLLVEKAQQQQAAAVEQVDNLLDVDRAPEVNAHLRTDKPLYTGVDMAQGHDQTVQHNVSQQINLDNQVLQQETHAQSDQDIQQHDIGLAPAAKQGETITKTIGGFKTVEKLTPHESMIKEVRFWAKEYGVINSELSDLMMILNKY